MFSAPDLDLFVIEDMTNSLSQGNSLGNPLTNSSRQTILTNLNCLNFIEPGINTFIEYLSANKISGKQTIITKGMQVSLGFRQSEMPEHCHRGRNKDTC